VSSILLGKGENWAASLPVDRRRETAKGASALKAPQSFPYGQTKKGGNVRHSRKIIREIDQKKKGVYPKLGAQRKDVRGSFTKKSPFLQKDEKRR